ncbi:hypothetical protein Efla_006009 [Eimeria flavescens]
MEDDIHRMGLQEAKALVRPTLKHYKGSKTKHKRIHPEQLLKKVSENQSQNEEEGERGGNGCALTVVSAVGEGTDPAGETPDSAAVKGQLPRKKAVYRVVGEELEAQRKSLQQLKENKWRSLTSSPFAAPFMVVTKKDDASGQKQFCMVVNYQELNSLTIAAEYPLPTI